MIPTIQAGRRPGDGSTLIRGLGWFSIVLGLTEIAAGGRIARALGQRDGGGLVRLYGWREIGSGLLCLAHGPAGVASRLAGDALDLATLAPGLDERNLKRANVGLALAMVAGIGVLDLIAAARAVRRPGAV